MSSFRKLHSKNTDTLSCVCIFCGCPLLLLYLYDQYTARKGECEGCAPQGAFRSATAAARRHLARRWNLCGFPRSRSVTRPQATTFASAKVPLQKETPSFRMVFSFWSGRRGSNSLPGIPRTACAIRRNPASPLDLTRFAQVEAASSFRKLHSKKYRHTFVCLYFLERATRLELATSTLARSRSTR